MNHGRERKSSDNQRSLPVMTPPPHPPLLEIVGETHLKLDPEGGDWIHIPNHPLLPTRAFRPAGIFPTCRKLKIFQRNDRISHYSS